MHEQAIQYTKCSSGCVCKSGFVWDSDRELCVKPTDCPCHHGGKSYAEGDEILEECTSWWEQVSGSKNVNFAKYIYISRYFFTANAKRVVGYARATLVQVFALFGAILISKLLTEEYMILMGPVISSWSEVLSPIMNLSTYSLTYVIFMFFNFRSLWQIF